MSLSGEIFEKYPVYQWNRSTVADGRALNQNTILTLSGRDAMLASAIDANNGKGYTKDDKGYIFYQPNGQGGADYKVHFKDEVNFDNKTYITRNTSESDSFYVAQNGDAQVSFGVGSSKINKGIYDNIRSNWMICTDKDDGTHIIVGKDLASNKINIGNSTIGTDTKPVYLKDGIITASNGNVGSNNNPVYLKDGIITASNKSVGSDTKPVKLVNGVITEVANELAKKSDIPSLDGYAKKTDITNAINNLDYDNTISTNYNTIPILTELKETDGKISYKTDKIEAKGNIKITKPSSYPNFAIIDNKYKFCTINICVDEPPSDTVGCLVYDNITGELLDQNGTVSEDNPYYGYSVTYEKITAPDSSIVNVINLKKAIPSNYIADVIYFWGFGKHTNKIKFILNVDEMPYGHPISVKGAIDRYNDIHIELRPESSLNNMYYRNQDSTLFKNEAIYFPLKKTAYDKGIATGYKFYRGAEILGDDKRTWYSYLWSIK